MSFPEVELRPGEDIHRADEKVEKAFEEQGLTLVAYEGLNSFLDIGSACHFFQVPLDGEVAVIVVHTDPWDEKTLIQVLNVLLELRLDPDPPGSRVRVRFYSGHEVPPVLSTVFGDSDCSRLESRALLVTRFGHELQPQMGLQLAALGAFLLRDIAGVAVDFDDPHGPEILDEIIIDRFGSEPECVEPVNTLIALGALYGELLRGLLATPGRWVADPSCAPWPGIAVGADGGPPVWNPIGHAIHAFQSRERGYLARTAQQLIAERSAPVGDEGSSPL